MQRLLRAIAYHHSAVPVVHVAPRAQRIAAVGWLDLDDVGPEVREQHRGERPGNQLPEFEDAEALQRRGHAPILAAPADLDRRARQCRECRPCRNVESRLDGAFVIPAFGIPAFLITIPSYGRRRELRHHVHGGFAGSGQRRQPGPEGDRAALRLQGRAHRDRLRQGQEHHHAAGRRRLQAVGGVGGAAGQDVQARRADQEHEAGRQGDGRRQRRAPRRRRCSRASPPKPPRRSSSSSRTRG